MADASLLKNSSTRAAVTILVMLLPIAGGGFYFLSRYAERRHVELTNRNQRELALVARQLEGRLEAARVAWGSACKTADRRKLEAVQLACLIVDEPSAGSPAANCDDRPAPPPVCPPPDSGVGSVEIEAKTQRLLLKGVSTCTDVPTCEGHADLSCLFERAVPEPLLLDAILMTTKAGTVVGRRGLELPITSVEGSVIATASSAAAPSKKEGTERPKEASVDDIVVGPVHYVPFVQPAVRLHATQGEAEQLFLVGLVSRTRLDAEKVEMPYRWTIASGLLLLLGLFAWPVLKLWFMGPGERVSLVDAKVLVVTSVLATTLVAGGFYGMLTMQAAWSRLDVRMQKMAGWLERQLHRELREANLQRRTAEATLQALRVHSTPDGAAPACPATLPIRDPATLLPGPTVLIAPNGSPICRWELDHQRKPPELVLSIGESPCLNDRGYFVEARSRTTPWTSLGGGRHVTLEVVRSRLDAKDLLSIARLVDTEDEPIVGDGRDVLVTTRESAVFRAPILPPRFAFAIVDAHGRVQLHSDPGRNQEENLFAETDDATELAASIAARRRRFVDFQYGGSDYRGWVRPIAHSPWSIVVLLDKREFRAVFAEVAIRWSFLFLAYLGVWALLLGVVQAINERYRAPWIWPDRHGIGTGYYLFVAYALALVGLAVTAMFEQGGALQRAGVLIATPFTTIAVSYLMLGTQRAQRNRRGIASSRTPWAERRFRAAYVTMIAALLMVAAGMPAILLWKDATESTLGELDVAMAKGTADRYESALRERRAMCADRPDRCLAQTRELQTAVYWWTPLSGDDGGPLHHLGLDDLEILPVHSPLAATLRLVPHARVRSVHLNLLADRNRQFLGGRFELSIAVGTVLLIGFGIIWSVVTRLFLLDVDRPDLVDVGAAEPANVVWVVGPHTGFQLVSATSAKHALLDLRWMPSEKELPKWFADTAPADRIQIDHLEARFGQEPWEQALLDGLETTVARGRTIILTSRIDLAFHLHERATQTAATSVAAPDGARAATIDRWARLLSCLATTRHELDADVRGNDAVLLATFPQRWSTPRSTAKRSAEEGLHRAAYRAAWSESTPRERLAMTHLAQEGFLNPNDLATARQLFRRGLVYREQQFRFPTAAFKRFARGAESSEQIRAWETGAAGIWAKVGFPLQTTLALVGALLVSTQEQLRTASIAIPTALASALPILINLVGKLGGDADTSKSRPNGS